MKLSNIAVLLVFLLPLSGYDEKNSVANSPATLTASQLKQFSPDEELVKIQSEVMNAVAQFHFDSCSGYSEYMESIQKNATVGIAYEQSTLGCLYAFGYGVSKDSVKAVEWFQRAAGQGYALAQFQLGVMYYNGNGVPKDAIKAVEWFQKSAAFESTLPLGDIRGVTEAQSALGIMYANGIGVTKDAVKAIEWLQKAAIGGNHDAQTRLGLMYANGEGVPKDATRAARWYLASSEPFMNNGYGQYFLGRMYSKGNGAIKDEVKAVEWYKKSADAGFAPAKYRLGIIYEAGEGVIIDRVKAYAWFNLAAAQGHPDALSYRDELEKELTSAERAEGQRLASNWKKGDTLLVTNDKSSVAAPPKWDELSDTPPETRKNGAIKAKLNKQATGTAFAVSNEGHALTNHHVINGCTEVKVAGREGVAKVITSDSVNDLALLQLPGKSDAFAKLNPDPDKLRQGEDVIVFGYPLNFALSSGGNLTPGTLSALTGLGNNTNQIQITAPIQPGSSGSPVMDKKGNVMAVVSMTLDDGKMTKITGQVGQNVNFAVNGQTVKLFLDANKVAYKTGGGFFSTEKSNADIADEARKWTVLVECWK